MKTTAACLLALFGLPAIGFAAILSENIVELGDAQVEDVDDYSNSSLYNSDTLVQIGEPQIFGDRDAYFANLSSEYDEPLVRQEDEAGVCSEGYKQYKCGARPANLYRIDTITSDPSRAF